MKGLGTYLKEFWNGQTLEEKQLSKIVRSEFVKERPERVNFERLMRYFELTPQINLAVHSYSELITGTDMVITADNDEAKDLLDEWVRRTDFYNKFEGLVTTLLICGTAIFEKLDTQDIEDVIEVDMTSIVNKRRDEFGVIEHYKQRQQQGQIIKLSAVGDDLGSARDLPPTSRVVHAAEKGPISSPPDRLLGSYSTPGVALLEHHCRHQTNA